VLTKASDLKEAMRLLEGVRVDYVERYGEADASTAKAELWLGFAQLRAGDADAAGALLRKLDASQAKFTPLMKAQRLTLHAEIAEARHDPETALAARKDAWDAMRTGQGERHPLTAEFGIAYASALASSGRAAQARAIAEPLVSIVAAAFAPGSRVRTEAARWDGVAPGRADAARRSSGQSPENAVPQT
jgi:hypothetical protein